MLTQTEQDAQGQVLFSYQFSYDAVGNIVAETVEPNLATLLPANTEMSYGLANRLATVDQQSVTLDADGNMVEGVLQGALTQFSYDARNRLIQAGSTQYQYDAENQRIAVDATQFVVNSQPNLSQVLVRTKGNGEVTYYVYGLGLIGEQSAGNYFSYHFDYRGSTVVITDTTGQIIDTVQYSPFGVVLAQPTFDTPFLFNGLYGVMTDDNSLSYMRARYYSAEIRRFVNQDVLLGDVADGQSLNRFAFVTGNPVSFIDPFGLETIIIITEDKIPGLPILFGSHAALYIENNEQNIIYDPAGGYSISKEVNGDIVYDASINDFLEMHNESKIIMIYFQTTEEEESLILENAEYVGAAMAGFCAVSVGQALRGVGPFKDLSTLILTPGSLEDALTEILRNN